MKPGYTLLLLAAWMAALSISSAALVPGFSGSVSEPFVFYGYAPPTIKLVYYGNYSMYHHIGSNPILDVVGITDGTGVGVYDIAGGEVIDSFTVNRMELYETTLRES